MSVMNSNSPIKANSHYLRLLRTVALLLLAFAAIAGDFGPKMGFSPLSGGLIAFTVLLVILWMWDQLPGVRFNTKTGNSWDDGLNISAADRQKIENMPPVQPLQKPRVETKRPPRVKKIAR